MHEFLYILVECVYNYGKLKRLKIKIFNHEICDRALLVTNSMMRRKQRRNEENLCYIHLMQI